jgi:dipeptidase
MKSFVEICIYLVSILVISVYALAYSDNVLTTTDGCTTILVTPGATANGSLIVTHSDDNELMDQRFIYVPAADHEPGSLRPVYCSACALGEFKQYNSFFYPRLVAPERAPGYDTPDYPASVPLGYIPQVPHTYAYFDGSYGIMNEHQLMIGECTDGAKIQPNPDPKKRLFYSSELSRVALERCTTAREAVELMGELIDTYGYYGTGETLLVGDPNEGWVFEMCGDDIDGIGGLWVAKRVPDGELFVAANEFRIREIDPNDPDILYCKNLFKSAEAHGWWKPSDGPLDWLKTVSLGEYNHPYYSLRRVWRVLSMAAPSLELSPWVEDGYTKDYPFSVKPDKLLTVSDVMELHRNHYEGTEFDMTKGLAAGPFGCPNRSFGPYDGKGDVGDPKRKLEGAWERPLSVSYCGYLYVNQGRNWLPDPIGGICWFGPDKPTETCFAPFYCGVTTLPSVYQVTDTDKFDRESAWWAFNFVANWAELKFSYISADIREKRDPIEQEEMAQVKNIDAQAQELYQQSPDLAREYLTKYSTENSEKVVRTWWAFADELIAKYDDGYISIPGNRTYEVGYPQAWRDAVGYSDGPTTYSQPQ